MNKAVFLASVSLLVSIVVSAQTQPQTGSTTNFVAKPISKLVPGVAAKHLAAPKSAGKPVSQRIRRQDTHYRVWETVQNVTNADNQVVQKTNTYTELANGLNYKQNGVWQPTSEQIEITSEGAVAVHGPHKVSFAANVNNAVAVNLTTPEGRTLKSHIVGLAYYDFKSDKQVLFAELKDSVGQLVGTNQVLYPDAFTDVKADVLYTYTKAGLEQDVILRERPPQPALYGLNYETTRLQVYTEFLNPPQPAIKRNIKHGWKKATVDTLLDFGNMKIGRGTAFNFGDRDGKTKGIEVEKHWRTINGRSFLVEEVGLRSLTAQLSALPSSTPFQSIPGSTTPNSPGKTNASSQALIQQASAHLKLPAPKAEKVRPGAMTVASLPTDQKGLVLDYAIVSYYTDFVFQGDTTYYIPTSSLLYLYGTTVIEGGTVVKYDRGSQIFVTSGAVCKTDMYHPAIFTAVDDDTVGEVLYDYSAFATPTSTYANTALAFYEGCDLHDLRVLYADQGISCNLFSGTFNLNHCQILHCNTGLALSHCVFQVGNLLMYDVQTGFGGEFYNGTVEHLTIDQAALLTSDDDFHYDDDCMGGPSSSINLANSIIAGVADLGIVPLIYDPDNVAFYSSSTGVFQAASNGAHYLPAASSCRGIGTPYISSTLLADLKKRTTRAPVELPLFTQVNGSLTFSPVVQRDTNSYPDLGYHYDALDFTVACLNVKEGSSVTVLPGTAIGVRNDPWPDLPGQFSVEGFIFYSGTSFTCHGMPTNPIAIADLHLVQEGPFGIPAVVTFAPFWVPQNTMDGLGDVLNPQNLPPPSLSLRFANLYCGQMGFNLWAGTDINYYGLTEGLRSAVYWDMQDCTIHNGFVTLGFPDLNLSVSPFPPAVIAWTNNLFDRAFIQITPDMGTEGVDLAFSAYNNLFYGGRFFVFPVVSSLGNWTIQDNLFDQVTFWQNTGYPLDYDHNAYWPLSSAPTPFTTGLTTTTTGDGFTDAAHDVALTTAPPYAAGPLGNYYLPGSFATYGAGSRTPAAAGLYHYTTKADQTKEGSETTGHQVNIGLHYVATSNSTSIIPYDYDGDGIPDYVENWHGDNAYTTHTDTETDWQNQYTATGILDPTNSIYDDIDLSGNGFVGRVKKALGTSAFDTSQTLQLTQEITGREPSIITFSVPLNYNLLTNIGTLNLFQDGTCVTMDAVTRAADGSVLLEYNSTFEANGQHCLQARFGLKTVEENSAIINGFGTITPIYSSNLVRFFEESGMYSDSIAYLDAKLSVKNANYTIQIWDPSTTPETLISSIANSTFDGRIQENWDVTYTGGSPFTGDVTRVVYTIFPLDDDGYPAPIGNPYVQYGVRFVNTETSPYFDFTYMYTCRDNSLSPVYNIYDGEVTWGMQGVVDALLMPVWGYDVYYSTFNRFSYPFYPGDPGFLYTPGDVTDLYTSMKDGLTRNFYCYAHGSSGALASGSGNVRITASEVTNQLYNLYDVRTGSIRFKNPYRLVFLDGCSTASTEDWRHAFGILRGSGPRSPLGPQAFVGWEGLKTDWMGGLSGDIPIGSELAIEYTDTMDYFYTEWMLGSPLGKCISDCSNYSIVRCPFPTKNITSCCVLTGVGGACTFVKNSYPGKILVKGHSGLTFSGLNSLWDGLYVN